MYADIGIISKPRIPAELLLCVGEYLSASDLVNMMLGSRYFRNLFMKLYFGRSGIRISDQPSSLHISSPRTYSALSCWRKHPCFVTPHSIYGSIYTQDWERQVRKLTDFFFSLPTEHLLTWVEINIIPDEDFSVIPVQCLLNAIGRVHCKNITLRSRGDHIDVRLSAATAVAPLLAHQSLTYLSLDPFPFLHDPTILQWTIDVLNASPIRELNLGLDMPEEACDQLFGSLSLPNLRFLGFEGNLALKTAIEFLKRHTTIDHLAFGQKTLIWPTIEVSQFSAVLPNLYRLSAPISQAFHIILTFYPPRLKTLTLINVECCSIDSAEFQVSYVLAILCFFENVSLDIHFDDFTHKLYSNYPQFASNGLRQVERFHVTYRTRSDDGWVSILNSRRLIIFTTAPQGSLQRLLEGMPRLKSLSIDLERRKEQRPFIDAEFLRKADLIRARYPYIESISCEITDVEPRRGWFFPEDPDM